MLYKTYPCKGIILVAGNGTRLAPITLGTSKPLLPVYDKPMIYYPLSTLMQAGIKDILIITNQKDQQKYVDLLGNGENMGIHLQYAVQPVQRGIADAFIIAEDFIGRDSVCLILGDNIYTGASLLPQTQQSAMVASGAEIYGYAVSDPRRFGVAVFDQNDNVTAVEEKPENPKSNMAVTGLYFFDNNVVEIAKHVQPSKRGELEITDVINAYIERGQCKLNRMANDVVWMDVGTFESLNNASNYVRTIQTATSRYVGCIEQIAFEQGYINSEQLKELAQSKIKSEYGKYIDNIANSELSKKQKVVTKEETMENTPQQDLAMLNSIREQETIRAAYRREEIKRFLENAFSVEKQQEQKEAQKAASTQESNRDTPPIMQDPQSFDNDDTPPAL